MRCRLSAACRKTSVSRATGSAGVDEICQYPAGADRRELINVADQEKSRAGSNCLGDRIHQRHVHHAGLINDQKVTVEWIVRTFPKSSILRIDFEQPMYRFCLKVCLLAHALGRPPGGRGEQQPDAFGKKSAQDRVEKRGFPDSRAASYDAHFRADYEIDGIALRSR